MYTSDSDELGYTFDEKGNCTIIRREVTIQDVTDALDVLIQLVQMDEEDGE